LKLTSVDRDAYVGAIRLLKPLGIPLHSAIEEYVAARALLGSLPLLPALQEHLARRHSVIEKPVSEIVDELLESKEHALRAGGMFKRFARI
jgi:hypothetical protein